MGGEIEIYESYFGTCRIRDKCNRVLVRKPSMFGMLKCNGFVYTRLRQRLLKRRANAYFKGLCKHQTLPLFTAAFGMLIMAWWILWERHTTE